MPVIRIDAPDDPRIADDRSVPDRELLERGAGCSSRKAGWSSAGC